MCLIHLSGPDSLRLLGDLKHSHVGHRTSSLTFGYRTHFQWQGPREGETRMKGLGSTFKNTSAKAQQPTYKTTIKSTRRRYLFESGSLLTNNTH